LDLSDVFMLRERATNFDRDLDLFLFDLGQFGLDEVFLVIFGNVNQWRPFCEGDRFLVTIPTLWSTT